MKSSRISRVSFRRAVRSTTLLIAFLPYATANSADFSLRRADTGTRYEIMMQGDIVQGDASRLSKLIASNPAKFIATQTIYVSSSGGNVNEAIKLAGVIEDSALDLFVPMNDECASACFLLYVSAMKRSSAGALLIHRPYISPKGLDPSKSHEASKSQQDSISKVRVFLERKSVPSALIDKMMMLPSTEAYELTDKDQYQIGYMNPFLEELAIEKCGLPNSGVASDYRNGQSSKDACVDNKILIRLRFEYLARTIGSDRADIAMDQAKQLQKLGFPD